LEKGPDPSAREGRHKGPFEAILFGTGNMENKKNTQRRPRKTGRKGLYSKRALYQGNRQPRGILYKKRNQFPINKLC